MQKDKPHIREIKVAEIYFLEEMLFQAIFIPEGNPALDKKIIFEPFLHHYIKDFGQKNDFALVTESEGKLVGAIWIRLFSEAQKGYGFVDADTPEVSMAIEPDFRNQGIGSQLLGEMLEKMQTLNYKQVSLSVDTRNFAYQLYLKFGFQVHEMSGHTAVMVKVF
jgi:[ribosomal protein S18]-alanine N-acetyltransferase